MSCEELYWQSSKRNLTNLDPLHAALLQTRYHPEYWAPDQFSPNSRIVVPFFIDVRSGLNYETTEIISEIETILDKFDIQSKSYLRDVVKVFSKRRQEKQGEKVPTV